MWFGQGSEESSMGMTLNDGLIPSATEAIGMALGPGRAHDRRAGTDGTDNRAPVEETGRETKSFAVDGRFSILRSVTKSPPQSIQRGVWPRVHCLQTRVQRRQESRQLLIRRHPNHLQHQRQQLMQQQEQQQQQKQHQQHQQH